ncbi:lytic transglycosylase domain-containing protein [Sphingoaurantiacus capsulatus]|uniref:Lytic transglycosylase domain-containing protein n=1 Tax=Sphingoaurantiacus capsulatus TaxID=1771310 RepID=A0ABV7XBV9_9SPHN
MARLVNSSPWGFMYKRIALLLAAVAASPSFAQNGLDPTPVAPDPVPGIVAVPAPAQPPLPPVEAPPAIIDPHQTAFQAWLTGPFRQQAFTAGVRPETLDRELGGLTYNPRVVQLDQAQPDRSATSQLTYATYLSRHINNNRINGGRRRYGDLFATLQGIEGRYGVPPEVLVGFWGIETSYGAVTGNFDLVRSLATLAFEGRRRDLFSRELVAALQLIERGYINRGALVGSWAGATGQPQFLPSSVLAHAADGDGDGRADIWNSQVDALASIAKFIADKGWKKGQPWAQRVYVPPTLDRERVRNLTPVGECGGMNWRHSRWLTVKDWKALGIVPMGQVFPAETMLATLIEPDGTGTGGYLTYGNYRAILRYNCTNFYALTVTHLADAIRAAPGAGAAGGLRR